MDRMQFKSFIWPENPETFRIQAVRNPIYTINDTMDYAYEGLGPLCREISGRGVFCGQYAVQNYNTLQVLMGTGTVGELTHPLWGTMKAFLTGLTMDMEGRENYIAYTFTFREADEDGMIPPLPEEMRTLGT